ncbi:MAG TPA: hypothetical protein VF988_13220 [Verrucomicrobiae bacterium]
MKRLTISAKARIFLAVFVLGFVFVAYTERAWEDYWITFRASRNLATGNGLVFTPGERVHSFTSPLGVLLPAGLSWLTGNGSEELILWLFRLVCLAALAGGMVLVYAVLKNFALRPLAIGFTLALLALDAKTLDFSTNGMETGLLIFFVALSLHGLFVSGPRQCLRLGLGWAGLMWTRPDGCVYIAAMGVGALLFLRREIPAAEPARWLAKLSRAALLCAALYLPWFLWAWWYYGSPVPHTIVAKDLFQPPLHPASLVAGFFTYPITHMVDLHASIWWTFLPTYSKLDTWQPIIAIGGLAAWLAALAWLCPLFRPATRVLSFSFYVGQYFLTDVVRNFFPWYFPGVALLGYMVLGLVFDEFLGLAGRLPEWHADRGWLRHARPVLLGGAVFLLVAEMGLTFCAARLAHVQQQLIEDGARRPIGLWLRAHAASPHDTVLLEPLGYIGYFSGLKMYDFPGLCSKEMVAVRRRLGPEKQNQAYLELKPDWLVLRPVEAHTGELIDITHLAELYEPVVVVDVSDRVAAYLWLPGSKYLAGDETFIVYHRKSALPSVRTGVETH